MKKPPKPKRPKVKAPAKPAPPQAPPQTLAPTKGESSKQLLLAALRTWWGKVGVAFAFLGAFQTALGTVGFFKDAYERTKPDIQISGDAKSPFSLPLTVHNQSSIFPMYDIEWTCGAEKIVTRNGGGISGIGFRFADSPTYIKPNGSALFPCRIIDAASSATIVPIMRYKTLGVWRSFDERQFTWFGDSDPPRWLPSDRP